MLGGKCRNDSVLPIFSGVVIFVLGQFLLKLLVEPVQEFKKTIADVALVG